MKLLKDIIYGIRIIEIKGNTNIAVENIAFDSREINNLSLFIAVKESLKMDMILFLKLKIVVHAL